MKTRVSNHYSSFKDPKRETETKLSEQMWQDKRENIVLDLTWEKTDRAMARGPN